MIIKSKLAENTNSTKFSQSNIYESPGKVIIVKKMKNGQNNYSNITKKSPNQKINMMNINNDKSVYTKNNININIQPAYKKDKYDFNELPYIK